MSGVVIIGNSAAGIAAAEAIRHADRDREITILSDEPGPAYSRCLLSYYLAGKIGKDDLVFRGAEFYTRNRITLRDNCAVTAIAAKEKAVMLANGERLAYEQLVIASGAAAKLPAGFAPDDAGVFPLRTVRDAERIVARLDAVETVAILGAGLVGLKAAQALHARGKKVVLIAKSKSVLSQILDPAAGEFLAGIVGKHLSFRSGLDATKVESANNRVSGLRLDNGDRLACQLVIVAKGVVPNLDLARGAGLTVGAGIRVDEAMRTSDPDIYAAGDVAETADLVTGERELKPLWTNAVEQGRVAGRNIAGTPTAYPGALAMNSIECFGVPCISSGNMRTAGAEVYEHRSEAPLALRRIAVKGNRVVGFITIGEIALAGLLNALIVEKKDVAPLLGKLASASLRRPDLLACLAEGNAASLMEK